MNRSTTLVLAGVLLLGGLAATALAQEQELSEKDKDFVHGAAVGGIMEVGLGNIAKEKAQSQEVKDFGARMATDHGKANEELKSLAQKKNLTLPKELDKKHQKTVEQLKKTSGTDFDKKYMQEMVKDHAKDVATFRNASRTVKDPELKAWADKTLPVLEEHLQLARKVAKNQKVDVEKAEGEGRKEAEKKK